MAGSAATYLNRIARELQSLPRQWANDSVRTIRKAVTKQLAGDTGGDLSLSGAPGKLKVDAKVTGETVVHATITPGPRRLGGIWSWLEGGTQPHTVGGMFKGARHPGTAAKRTWSKATEPALQKIAKDGRDRAVRVIQGY